MRINQLRAVFAGVPDNRLLRQSKRTELLSIRIFKVKQLYFKFLAVSTIVKYQPVKLADHTQQEERTFHRKVQIS